MNFLTEYRPSDSPFLETITQGRTLRAAVLTRPAEIHWHMVLTRYQGASKFLLVGPWSQSGEISIQPEAEVLWLKFKLGVFMPNWPVQKYRDSEIVLPEARSDAFWLHSAVWQFPNFENAELFVEKLAQADMLAHDTLVKDVLQDRPPDLTARTIRHRFRRATGLTQSQIRQYERAQQAVRLLKQGASILDTVFDSGYFDQPHLTRALKHWIGYTPAEYANTIQAP